MKKLDTGPQPTLDAEFKDIMKQLERPSVVQTGAIATRRFFSDLRELRDQEISR